MKKQTLKASGFSLMEVMIAGALISVISLTVAKMTQNANKSVMKVKTDLELLEFQNYLKGRLLDHVTCAASDFGEADMFSGTELSSYNPTGPAEDTTGYRTVTTMRIGPTTKPWDLASGQKIDGFPSWTMEEMRVYNIIELPAAGSNQGICTLYFRAKRLGNQGGERSIGSRDKSATIQLSCQVDPTTKVVTYCVNANSVTKGYWTANNDSDTSEGITYPDNVTIGTKAAPVAALSVYPDSINSSEWFTDVSRAIDLPVNSSFNMGDAANSYGLYSDNSCLKFRKTGLSEDTLSICDNYVGIGTTTPQTAIHISGTGALNDDVLLESNSDTITQAGQIIFQRSLGSKLSKAPVTLNTLLGGLNAQGWDGSSYGEAGGINIYAESAFTATAKSSFIQFVTNNAGVPSEQVRIRSNGNVGIGTSNPTQKLEVNGNVALSGSITLSSDRRFKKNIHTITRPLSKIKKLRGVEYLLRADEFPQMDFNSNNQLGFIAQEVESVLPDLVQTSANGYKSLNYQSVIPLLVEGQKALIEKLKLQSESQRIKINKLEMQNSLMIEEILKIKEALESK